MSKRKKILVIDDEPGIRETLFDLFELMQYKCIAVHNGKEGIKAAQKELPDLIICDVTMPEIDGYGVLTALSKIPSTASIPFIFLTAKTEIADLRKGMESGADDYLFKPFTMDELTRAIDARFLKIERLTGKNEEKSVQKKIQRDSHMMLMVNDHPETIKVQNIIYLEAMEHYCNVYTSDSKKLLVRKSMVEWEEILPEDLFVRIHRSLIINLDFVVKFEKWFNNSFRVYLKNIAEPFLVSRRYSSKIRARIKL